MLSSADYASMIRAVATASNLSPSLQASSTVLFWSICSDKAVRNWIGEKNKKKSEVFVQHGCFGYIFVSPLPFCTLMCSQLFEAVFWVAGQSAAPRPFWVPPRCSATPGSGTNSGWLPDPHFYIGVKQTAHTTVFIRERGQIFKI